MPCLIVLGTVSQNTPQENGGIFIGEGNLGGWDANMKINQGHGGYYGFFNFTPAWVNMNVDNMEVIDGIMNDQDVKLNMAVDV